jgi:hypothetical protein
LTWPPGGMETVRSSSGPGHVTTRRVMYRAIAEAGFEIREEVGCGVEDLPLINRLPTALFVRGSPTLGRAPWTPTRVVLLRAAENSRESEVRAPGFEPEL